MTELSDLLLIRPLSPPWARFLLFLIFSAHLLFVLILIGTAFIGVQHFLHAYTTGENFELRWDKQVLKKFIIPKALAVVIGVGALLVIQLYFSIPFYTAMSLFGWFWLAVIPIMIVAFLCIDGISHKLEVRPGMSFSLGILGLLFLLVVPAIFVTVLVATEQSAAWSEIARRGFRFDGALSLHWLMRYLHILGASLVFGAAFQYFMTAEGHEYRERNLTRWMVLGLLLQFVTGGGLALTLQQWLSRWSLLPASVGIGAAGVLLWHIYRRASVGIEKPAPSMLFVGLPVLLISMLLTREYIQHRRVIPLVRASEQVAHQYGQSLADLRPQALGAYQTTLRIPYDNGPTIFQRSCTFCHGLDGGGDAPQAAKLVVPPERIRELRSSRAHIYEMLKHGVPGSAMPYFSIYTRDKLDALIAYLDRRFDWLGKPANPPVTLTAAGRQGAEQTYLTTCSVCHSEAGRPSRYGAGLVPTPPDFHHMGLTPQRAFEVITDGYPGTAMQPFAELPEDVRWGLVSKVNAFRRQEHAMGAARVARAASQSQPALP